MAVSMMMLGLLTLVFMGLFVIMIVTSVASANIAKNSVCGGKMDEPDCKTAYDATKNVAIATGVTIGVMLLFGFLYVYRGTVRRQVYAGTEWLGKSR